jgi:hypothetical protein
MSPPSAAPFVVRARALQVDARILFRLSAAHNLASGRSDRVRARANLCLRIARCGQAEEVYSSLIFSRPRVYSWILYATS